MLATCPSCQTRFRVPDDLVGPKGARVRCSRCQALFVLRREEEAAVPGAALPPPLPGRPAPPPPPTTGAHAIDPRSDPFALARAPAPPPAPPPRDDPFAPEPFAPDPFAPEPAPGEFPISDLFLARPDAADPFAAPPAEGSATSPGAEPGALLDAGSGGLSLEAAEPRLAPRPLPAAVAAEAADLAADFRTPGPSGLEVDAPAPAPEAPEVPAYEPPPERVVEASPPQGPPRRAPEPPPAAPEEPAAVPLRRRALAVLVNSLSLALLLVLAGALFVTWRGGGTAALRAAAGARDPAFTVRDLSTGLYETARGRPVLFVRGRIAARDAGGPVRVRVELRDGHRAVARAEGLAGAVPTPEELWGSDPAREGELRAAMGARAAQRVGAGEALPFLVVLWEYPADLRGLEFQVVAEPAPAG